MSKLSRIILDTFGQNYNEAKLCIEEDIDNECSCFYHTRLLITSLLPEEYRSFDYNNIDGLIRHVKRTRRVGLCGLLHDYQSIYNLDAILSFLN